MTYMLEYKEHTEQSYNCITVIRRLTMKKLESHLVRHSFRQAKKL